MAYNKVVFGNDTLIDLTSDTVTENNLVEGVTAHNKSGEAITGTMKVVNISVVASEYSSSSTYSVGDYVIYSNKLYRCTTAISSGEAWNSGHWTEVKVSTELSQLNEDLADKANASDLTNHTGNTTVHVTSVEKNRWNGKQNKIDFSISIDDVIYKIDGNYLSSKFDYSGNDIEMFYATKGDLSEKQSALSNEQLNACNSGITSGKVNTYDEYANAISGKEASSNKITSLSSSSTDTQYPSAKCVYDLVGNVEALLEALL